MEEICTSKNKKMRRDDIRSFMKQNFDGETTGIIRADTDDEQNARRLSVDYVDGQTSDNQEAVKVDEQTARRLSLDCVDGSQEAVTVDGETCGSITRPGMHSHEMTDNSLLNIQFGARERKMIKRWKDSPDVTRNLEKVILWNENTSGEIDQLIE